MAAPPLEIDNPSAAEIGAIRHGATLRAQVREAYEQAMRSSVHEE